MTPTALSVSLAVLASLGTGVGLGVAIAPNGAAKALEAQREAIAELNAGNQALIAEVNAVALLDAERETAIATALTNVPPQCIPELGGDPMSPECAWSWCVRTGETDKQRCEVGKLTDYLIKRYEAKAACPDVE
jgi:hypothetical protein